MIARRLRSGKVRHVERHRVSFWFSSRVPVAILQTNSKHRSKFGNGCVRFEDGLEESRPGE
jgi:predicted dithiol-disulfide oxidoreductase (DUF899 family)